MDREEIREQIKIEPVTLILDILSSWWHILLGAIATALLVYVIANVTYTPVYETQATFVVQAKSDSNASNSMSAAYNMAQSFQKILQSSYLKKMVSNNLEINLSDLDADAITADVIEGSNLLILRVRQNTPKACIDLIREIMSDYQEASFYIVGNSVMDVLEYPSVPRTEINPLDVRGMTMKGFLAGAVGFIFLFGLLSYMKDTIKEEADISEKLDAEDLGAIPFEKKRKGLRFLKKKSALLVNSPVAGFGFVEAYKKLATKVDYQMSKNNKKVLVVTSVSENEGKSTVAANIALTLAQQSKKVILIDGDLRRPSLFLLFNIKPTEEQELGEFLKGKGKVSDILIKTEIKGLGLICGKNGYASSTEITQTERMRKLIMALKESVDYVIIDTPPAGMMGDAEVLAQMQFL